MKDYKVALVPDSKSINNIFEEEYLQKLKDMCELRVNTNPERATPQIISPLLKEAHICITSWGTPRMTKELLDMAPDLKMIIHAAGTVKTIVCDEVWERGIIVTSGAPALAVGVAETTLGLIIASLKNVWGLSKATREGLWKAQQSPEVLKCRELFNVKVGIIGASHVGRYLIKLLKNFQVEILVYDPIRTDDEIRALGGRKAELNEVFSISDIVTIHAPSIPATRGMVNKEVLRLMKNNAILINTARGDIINEDDLVEELKSGRITACLDVTSPEPPAVGSPLRSLPNVILTPHIAGLVNNGKYRLGRYAVEEVARFINNEKPLNEIERYMLQTIA